MHRFQFHMAVQAWKQTPRDRPLESRDNKDARTKTVTRKSKKWSDGDATLQEGGAEIKRETVKHEA